MSNKMKKETDLPEEKKQAIRPEELRIGNLALYKGEQITIDGVKLRWMQRCIQSDMPNNMTGIPLSPEWLERLGFYKVPLSDEAGHYFETKLPNGGYLIEGDRGGVCSCFVDGHTEWRVYTVHQLQNLYFALTGQELSGCLLK